MPGYLNRFIDLPFPDLGGTDDNGDAIVWVRIRNPRVTPTDHLLGDGIKARIGPDGKPLAVNATASDMYRRIAQLIVDGHVWDALSLEDEAPLIAMPPRPEDIGRLPIEITNAIAGELKKATNPR